MLYYLALSPMLCGFWLINPGNSSPPRPSLSGGKNIWKKSDKHDTLPADMETFASWSNGDIPP
jgi:hypothetical protein